MARKPSQPEVMDFEDFAAKHDAPQYVWDVATQRLPNTSEGQRKRIAKYQRKKVQENNAKRLTLREQYDQLVAEGKVRPPTRLEKLLRTAAGHPDKDATQAARRLLTKHYPDVALPEMGCVE